MQRSSTNVGETGAIFYLTILQNELGASFVDYGWSCNKCIGSGRNYRPALLNFVDRLIRRSCAIPPKCRYKKTYYFKHDFLSFFHELNNSLHTVLRNLDPRLLRAILHTADLLKLLEAALCTASKRSGKRKHILAFHCTSARARLKKEKNVLAAARVRAPLFPRLRSASGTAHYKAHRHRRRQDVYSYTYRGAARNWISRRMRFALVQLPLADTLYIVYALHTHTRAFMLTRATRARANHLENKRVHIMVHIMLSLSLALSLVQFLLLTSVPDGSRERFVLQDRLIAGCGVEG